MPPIRQVGRRRRAALDRRGRVPGQPRVRHDRSRHGQALEQVVGSVAVRAEEEAVEVRAADGVAAAADRTAKVCIASAPGARVDNHMLNYFRIRG